MKLEKDPNIFFDQYGNPRLVYVNFHGDRSSMGDPGLLGQYYWNGGSKADVLGEDLSDAVSVGIHEVEHGHYAHSETEHRFMESGSGFSDSRNYSKLRDLYEGKI
jgi:hypothetical protein